MVPQVVDGQECQTQSAQHLQVQAFLVGEADTCQQFPSMQDYLSGLIDIDKLSDTEICKLFGLEEKVLRDTFQPIVENILSIFYYLKTGKLIQEKDDYKNLNVIFGDENLEIKF